MMKIISIPYHILESERPELMEIVIVRLNATFHVGSGDTTILFLLDSVILSNEIRFIFVFSPCY